MVFFYLRAFTYFVGKDHNLRRENSTSFPPFLLYYINVYFNYFYFVSFDFICKVHILTYNSCVKKWVEPYSTLVG